MPSYNYTSTKQMQQQCMLFTTLTEQVVKVTWHKSTSLTTQTHTDGSDVFARWRQCAHPSSTLPNIIYTMSVLPTAKISTVRHVWACPRLASFRPQNYPFAVGSEPHLIQDSLGPPKSTSQKHLNQFSHFCRAHSCDRHTTLLCL